MVNIKLIIIAGAIIGFLALGGVSKVSPVFGSIGQQIELGKSGVTDFVRDIKNKTADGKAGVEG